MKTYKNEWNNATVEEIKNDITEMVSKCTVAEMRKAAPEFGIKNAKQYKRAQLSEMMVEVWYTYAVAQKASYVTKHAYKATKKATKNATKKSEDKRYKAKKVNDDEIQALADEVINDGISNVDLYQVNRKVLIRIMKMFKCAKWYRTYDKPTMIAKILGAVSAEQLEQDAEATEA